MNWIKENKFVASLAGITLLLSILLMYKTMEQNDEIEQAQRKLKSALKKEAKTRSTVPYPNQENLDAQKEIIDDYENSSRAFQLQFDKYKPSIESITDFPPDKFSKIVSTFKNELNKKFEANDVDVPEECFFGFEAYTKKFPAAKATGDLNYQIKAMQWLLESLAAKQPEALINVVRNKFESNLEESQTITYEQPYTVMPIELSFRSNEETFSEYIEEIANSQSYLFLIRSLRIQNERMTPPMTTDAKFKKNKKKSKESTNFEDAFNNFSFSSDGVDTNTDNSVESTGDLGALNLADKPVITVASDSDNQRIMLPILGSENINIFLNLDLILLKPHSAQSEKTKPKSN